MRLLVHLWVLSVGRLGVVCHAFGDPAWTLRAIRRSRVVTRSGRLVADRGQLCVRRRLPWYTNSLLHLSVNSRLSFARGTAIMGTLLCIGAVTLVVSLALCLFLLLLCLPLFADLLELFWGSLRTVRLHRDVRIQVIEGAIRLFTTLPATLVHALNLFIAPTRSLVLLRTWNWNEGVHRRKWMAASGRSLNGRDH